MSFLFQVSFDHLINTTASGHRSTWIVKSGLMAQFSNFRAVLVGTIDHVKLKLVLAACQFAIAGLICNFQCPLLIPSFHSKRRNDLTYTISLIIIKTCKITYYLLVNKVVSF